MIKIGDKVKIVYSYKLADMGMIFLANRVGEVVEVKVKDTKSPGVWLKVPNDIGIMEEWFIPIQSIRTKEYYFKKKNMKILKSLDL